MRWKQFRSEAKRPLLLLHQITSFHMLLYIQGMFHVQHTVFYEKN